MCIRDSLRVFDIINQFAQLAQSFLVLWAKTSVQVLDDSPRRSVVLPEPCIELIQQFQLGFKGHSFVECRVCRGRAHDLQTAKDSSHGGTKTLEIRRVGGHATRVAVLQHLGAVRKLLCANGRCR